MAILLIRHGETALNKARVVQPADTPLSERGLAQAAAVGRRLVREGVARILSSDQPRARMTAEAIARETSLGLDVDPLLAERNFGDIRGTPYSELGFDLFGADYHPPGGESWAEFHARVDRAWQRVLREAQALEGHLAVVSHGLVCRSVCERLIEIPAEVGALPSHWANTSLTRIEGGPPWRGILVNCTAHLEDALADDARALSGG